MKTCVLSLIACASVFAQPASLEGVTVDAVTQMPLARVHVSLVSMGVGTNLPEPDDAYGAISDDSGHYSIGNIRPGHYTLNPKRPGFVYVSDKDIATTPSISLKPGEKNQSYRIVMTPEVTIAGRVIDEFGDPVQGANVRVIAAGDVQPYGLWIMHDETNDRGEYRLSGMPGKFYIEASIPPLQTSGPPEIRTDGSSAAAYAATFYPGALAKERGTVIELAAGQELAGIDIHVAHRKSLKISGSVTGGSGAAPTKVTIRVRHEQSEAEDEVTAKADGSFVFANLAPAEYRLEAHLSGGPALQSPVVKVVVENDDATITLPLSAGEQMTGTVLVDGAPPGPTAREKWTVRLTPDDPSGPATKSGDVAADGSFTIAGIIPGLFQLTLDPLTGNAYIQSAKYDNAEIAGTDLDLTKGVRGSSLNIVVRRNGGEVFGSIGDPGGRNLLGRPLIVVLAADVTSFSTWRSATGFDGTYAFHGIRPGKYRLFAVDPAQFGGMQSYEPLKAVAARAAEIEVKEGDRITKNLRLSGKDGANAK